MASGDESIVLQELTVRAFAKVNFTLDVFSKRPDGYHGIASVMQAISISDTIDLRQTNEPGVHFTCDGQESEGIPLDDTNLVVRAAKATLQLGDAADRGVVIHLNKSLPSQAGLGGGSSDAAATIVGVDRLFHLNLPQTVKLEIAAELGSDVPFFLLGGTAVARGRGELLSPASHPAPLFWLVIVKPEENVSTGWAYGALDSDPERSSNRGTKRLEQALADTSDPTDAFDLVVGRMCNDFELPVFSHYPKLAWLNDELQMAGCRTARLCGSGSAMFGVVATETEANRIATLLRARYTKVFVARTLDARESDPLIGLTDGVTV